MKKPEILAPAGSYEKAKIAFMYGADAVYVGSSTLSLRTRVNMEEEDIYKIVEYAHNINKKIYVAINIFAFDDKYEEVRKQARILNDLKVDGIIVADGGVLEVVKEEAPNIDIHISTQANTVSYHAARFWHKNGAKRIILARELSKEQIKEIEENKPEDLEIEMFIHGAICFSYSGRCFLSDFLAGRSANLGDCAQSCRWSYNVYVEEVNNPGNLMPVEDGPEGTHIFSSKDLCLVKQLPEIIELGVESLKIEGRLKTEYYLATIVNAYRCALDSAFQDPEHYDYSKFLKEIEKTKTRGLTEFYFTDRNNKDFQEYDGKQYNLEYEYAGQVIEYSKEKSIIEIKNKLSIGDCLEMIIPGQIEGYEFTINELWDAETEETIETVNPGKQGQKVKLHIPISVQKNWVMRRKK